MNLPEHLPSFLKHHDAFYMGFARGVDIQLCRPDEVVAQPEFFELRLFDPASKWRYVEQRGTGFSLAMDSDSGRGNACCPECKIG